MSHNEDECSAGGEHDMRLTCWKCGNEYLIPDEQPVRHPEFGTRIVSVACTKPAGTDGKRLIFSLPAPHRHHDVVHLMARLGIQQDHTVEQGFLTDTGRFLRRKPAFILAEQAGQLIRPKEGGYQGPELFSEDLW